MKGKIKIREFVRKSYASIALKGGSCCPGTSCCGSDAKSISKSIGYSDKEMQNTPEGANLGLGCGNPVALASLKKGETVLDLGAGAGFDAFLAAKRVGKAGKVIGVDMTPEMVARARKNAEKGGYNNVEFRLGQIECLPVADGSVDAIISNCVINLSVDKPSVFREAFRVLKPGGRLMVSDLVLLEDLPEKIRNSVEAYAGCLAGACFKKDYLRHIKNAGFGDVQVVGESSYPIVAMANDATAKAVLADDSVLKKVENCVASVKVSAIKPLLREKRK